MAKTAVESSEMFREDLKENLKELRLGWKPGIYAVAWSALLGHPQNGFIPSEAIFTLDCCILRSHVMAKRCNKYVLSFWAS